MRPCPSPLAPQVNYRTHSGILEVASSVVDALKRFFPTHIDVLDRERAFFKVGGGGGVCWLRL